MFYTRVPEPFGVRLNIGRTLLNCCLEKEKEEEVIEKEFEFQARITCT